MAPRPSHVVRQITEAMSIKFNNLVYELKRAGADITVLSLGEAYFEFPLFSFDDLPFPAIYHYSHSRGIPELRARIARYYSEAYGVEADPATELLITAGSKMSIFMALRSVLDPGEEVIVHEPAWVSYTEQVRLCGGVPILVPYDVSVMDIERYVTQRTRAVIVNYPHNPRGITVTEGETAFLHDLAQRRDLFLIADEAYSDFVLPPDRFQSFGVGDPGKKHTIVCNSISKNFGLSGWRVGYSIASPEMTYQMLKVNQHLITCPATLIEYYLAQHFDQIIELTLPQIREVVARRNAMMEYAHSIGLETLPGSATFYFFLSIADSQLDSESFCTRLLRERGVSTVPGIGYGESCDRFIRVSVGTEPLERLHRGLDHVRELVLATRAAPAMRVSA